MKPTLSDRDLLVVAYAASPRIGDLVVVQLPRDAGGAPRPVAVKRLTGRDPHDPRRWWVERDNPNEGVDSWLVGGIPEADLLARVLWRLWPTPGRPQLHHAE